MLVLENIINDRGSRYAVSGGACQTADDAAAFLKELKRRKKFAKATHNSWACLTSDGPLKNDDGEAGAGMVIVRMLERSDLREHVIVVTRWFGSARAPVPRLTSAFGSSAPLATIPRGR